jgi:hypothetical protein
MRDSGAIEGAAKGFKVGDEVIVLKRYDNTVVKVIGHVDGIRRCECGFRFRLTRGDGLVLSSTAIGGGIEEGLSPEIDVYNSLREWVETEITAYDPITGYFTVSFVNADDSTDQNGYWVCYGCLYGPTTQYPYRYKTADKWKNEDLIKPGVYEDTIPYFKNTVTFSKEKQLLSGPWYEANTSDKYYLDVYADPLLITVNVDSSVPYIITSYCSCSFADPRVTSWNVACQYDAWNGLVWNYDGAATYIDQLGGSHTLSSGPIFDTIAVTGGSSGVSLSIIGDAPPLWLDYEGTGNVAVSVIIHVAVDYDI